MYRRLEAHTGPWDIIVVGGGATGAGVAIDAATRGYDVLLLEQSDFGKGTSSRSTKLVHGGVRYLEQGNVSLVMEALKERGLLLQNAPHLVRNLGFVVPNYDWWEAPFYGIGLKLYNLLAGKYGFGASRILSREETLERLPNLNTEGLRGGVIYFDGQFDDSRLLINLVATAVEQGATLLNYAQVTELTKDGDGFVNGVTIPRRAKPARNSRLRPKSWSTPPDRSPMSLRRKADPSVQPMIAPSQGIHLVFDGSFLAGDSAIMVPHTSDGRVMFAIPWHGHTLVGTTDTPIPEPALEPVAHGAGNRLHSPDRVSRTSPRSPTRGDVLSVFAGIRPLVRSRRKSGNTAALSRDHTIRIENSGMITICGGKWTTYRHMAEDCVNQAATLARLPERPCVTGHLNIHGFHRGAAKFGQLCRCTAPMRRRAATGWRREPALGRAAGHAAALHGRGSRLGGARRKWRARVEDVLARRTRALFLNARAAIEMAPKVASLMACELGRDTAWEAAQIRAFHQTARGFLLNVEASPDGVTSSVLTP